MKTQHRFYPRPGLLAVVSALVVLTACAPIPPSTPFIAPRAATPTPSLARGNTPVIPTPTPQPAATSSPTATPPCTDGLGFIQDITVPDGTIVPPSASIDKQWLVENNGTCNWDVRYRLKFAGGTEMGAAADQSLYPARAGNQATIRIVFTAPAEPGVYTTAWQATNPKGEPFGDPVFMEIIVQPEAEITLEVIETAPGN